MKSAKFDRVPPLKSCFWSFLNFSSRLLMATSIRKTRKLRNSWISSKNTNLTPSAPKICGGNNLPGIPHPWRWHRRTDRARNEGSFRWCTYRYLTTKVRVKSDSRWPTGSKRPNLHCFKQWDWSLDYHRNSRHFHRFCLQSDPRIKIWPKPFLSPIGTCIRCVEPRSWGNWSSGVNAPTFFP